MLVNMISAYNQLWYPHSRGGRLRHHMPPVCAVGEHALPESRENGCE